MMTSCLNTLGICVENLDPMQMLDPTTILPQEISSRVRKKINAVRNIVMLYEKSKHVKPTTIKGPKDIYNLLKKDFDSLNHEELRVVFLNTGNSVISTQKMFSGGLDSIVIDNRMIVKEALLKSATGVIIAHNHPSGNCMPSSSDIQQTQALAKALNFLQISLVDHLIIADNSYFSFADEKITSLTPKKHQGR